MGATTAPRPADLVRYLVAIAALAACLTILWASMRAVMDVGGMCASGGPYVIAHPCPEGVDVLLVGSILGGVAAVGGVAWFGARIGPGLAGVAALAWPALFLSLGWNFLEYGLAASGWDWSWLLCGVLFVAMGGLPLVVGIRGMRSGPRGGGRSRGTGPGPAGSSTTGAGARETRTTRAGVGPYADLARLLRQVQGVTAAEAGSVTVAQATGVDDADDGLVDQLERLARLKEQGALGELEYLQAKQAVIDAARKDTGS